MMAPQRWWNAANSILENPLVSFLGHMWPAAITMASIDTMPNDTIWRHTHDKTIQLSIVSTHLLIDMAHVSTYP